MKTHNILATIALALTLSGCDEVDPEDRFIEMPPIEAQRTVLLEEYTGQLCVNCPKAHQTVANLLAQHGDNLISVSIHAGVNEKNTYSATALPGYGLGTEQGETYARQAGVKSYPCGRVNRIGEVESEDKWAESVRRALAQPAVVDIAVSAALSDDGSSIDITTDLHAGARLKGYLQLWVVESGIHTLQYFPGNKIEADYEHNHIFRAAVNGINGTQIALSYDQRDSYSHTIAVDEHWNTANVSIVAFVYDNSGVLNACQYHLSEK